MSVLPVLLISFALQGGKAPEMRVIEVKPAGLAVSVPKNWGSNPKDSNLSASLKIPIQGSKNVGRMDIGYVLDESKDIEGFQEATKSVLTVGGNTIEKQWKVDVLDSQLALTRFSKNGSTTIRGVLFRPSKSKFVISVSSVTEDFSKVEPYLLSTMETLKEIKVVEPKKPNVAVEKKIVIPKDPPAPAPKLPISQQIVAGGKTLYFHFPAGTKVSKDSTSIVTAVVPGTSLAVTLTAYSSDGNPPSLIYQTKAAESAKLFSGGVNRIDKDYSNNGDKQVRDMIWRTGVAAKDSSPLMTCDCVTTQANSFYIHAFFTSTNGAQFEKERKLVTEFLLGANLTDKP